MSHDITKTLRNRSAQQAQMTALMHKIKAEQFRYIAVETLGKKTEKDTLLEASRHLTKATSSEILAALQEVESIKGKKYTGDPPYAGIALTLQQGGITKAELPDWITHCKRTTFASGNRYQPLPSHDEAWQAYSAVHTAITSKRLAAEQLKFRIPAVQLLDTEIRQAAEWGFWDDMSQNLKRRAFLLLPVNKQRAIREQDLTPEEAMQQTRAHFDNMQELFK